MIPESEIVDTVGAFSNRKKRFTVGTFDSYHKQILAVELDCAGVENGVASDTLHEERIGSRVEIVLPERRNHGCGKHRVLITVVDTIAFYGSIFASNQFFVLIEDERFTIIENIHF